MEEGTGENGGGDKRGWRRGRVRRGQVWMLLGTEKFNEMDSSFHC